MASHVKLRQRFPPTYGRSTNVGTSIHDALPYRGYHLVLTTLQFTIYLRALIITIREASPCLGSRHYSSRSNIWTRRLYMDTMGRVFTDISLVCVPGIEIRSHTPLHAISSSIRAFCVVHRVSKVDASLLLFLIFPLRHYSVSNPSIISRPRPSPRPSFL
jgi:hypothetical protein